MWSCSSDPSRCTRRGRYGRLCVCRCRRSALTGFRATRLVRGLLNRPRLGVVPGLSRSAHGSRTGTGSDSGRFPVHGGVPGARRSTPRRGSSGARNRSCNRSSVSRGFSRVVTASISEQNSRDTSSTRGSGDIERHRSRRTRHTSVSAAGEDHPGTVWSLTSRPYSCRDRSCSPRGKWRADRTRSCERCRTDPRTPAYVGIPPVTPRSDDRLD